MLLLYHAIDNCHFVAVTSTCAHACMHACFSRNVDRGSHAEGHRGLSHDQAIVISSDEEEGNHEPLQSHPPPSRQRPSLPLLQPPRPPQARGSDDPCVLCPLGCNQWVPASQMDSHELLHQVWIRVVWTMVAI